MNNLITHMKEVLNTKYPIYELVVSEVHDYYIYPFQLLHVKIIL